MTIWHWLKNIFKRPMPPQVVDIHKNEFKHLPVLPPAPQTSIVLHKAKPRESKKKYRKCPTMQKNMYTREQASAALSRLTTKLKPLRIYLCEYCNTWHLTHEKNGYGR